MATILLIDDDRSLLDVLALAFEDEGYDVLCAYDGEEGWLKFRNESPDLILSDVNMPKLDGYSLCRRLRDEGYDLPLILLTSRDNEIDEALGLELGADDYVAKPFSTRVLTARVKALLRRQEARAGGRHVDRVVAERNEAGQCVGLPAAAPVGLSRRRVVVLFDDDLVMEAARKGHHQANQKNQS